MKLDGNMEELFEILNPDGTGSGVLKPRKEGHRDGDLHGAAHIWIYRINQGKKEILLQKRSDDKDSFPGCYDISSAGHLDPGEDFVTGALRELQEELGIQTTAEKLKFLWQEEINKTDAFHGEIFRNHEIIQVYLFELDNANQKLYPQESEISEIGWYDASTLYEQVDTNQIHHCIILEDLRKVVNAVLER